MKKSHQGIAALLIISGLGMVQASSAEACSVSVNSLYQQNLLVGIAAAEMNISLTKATSIAVLDYTQGFSGSAGPSACPAYLNTSARVTINYMQNRFTRCSMSVTVNRSLQMGEVLMSGPFEAVSTARPISSCSLIPAFPRP